MSNQKTYDKPLPSIIDAERSVIGAILQIDGGAKALQKVLGIGLSEAHFNHPAPKSIYGAILRLHRKGLPIDLVSVAKELQDNGVLEEVGGVTDLNEIIDATPTAENVEYYAQMVMELAERRAYVTLGLRANDDRTSIEELREEYRRIAETRSRGFRNLQRPKAVDAETSLASDMPPVPMLISGGVLPDYGYTIMGGYAKSGKTTLALQMSLCLVSGASFVSTFSIERQARVLFCYLENSSEGISAILKKQKAEWGACIDASGLILQESQGLCLEYHEDREWLCDAIDANNIDLCVLDPVSLAMRKDQNAYEVVREFVLSIKDMGEQTNTAFLLIHHLRKPGAVKVEPMHALCGSSAWSNFAESIIALGRWAEDKPVSYSRLSLKVRTAAEPDDICLCRNPHGIFELYADPERIPKARTENVVAIVRDAGSIGYSALVELVKKAEGVSEATAKRKIKQAFSSGEIGKDSNGRYIEP